MAAVRGAWLALLWWILAEGQAGSLPLAAAGIALALYASLRFQRQARHRISVRGVLAFAAGFLLNSVRGGLQVARLAFSRAGPRHASTLTYPLASDDQLQHVLLVVAIGLMPGSVGVALERDLLRIHVIDVRVPVLDAVRATERSIARMFREAR